MRRSLFDQYQPQDIKLPRIRPNAFARLAQFCFRNSTFTILFWVLLSIACIALSSQTMKPQGIAPLSFTESSSAANDMARLTANFPNLYGLSKITLSSGNSENIRLARKVLLAKLEDRPELFAIILSPGAGSYYDINGLLYLSPEQVQGHVDYALSLRALFSAIAERPNTQSLATLVNEVSASIELGRDPQGLDALFNEAAKSVQALMRGVERPVDWTVVAGLAVDPAPKEARFMIVPQRGKNAEARVFLATAVRDVIGPFLNDANKIVAVEEFGDSTDKTKSTISSPKNIGPAAAIATLLFIFVLFAVLGQAGLASMMAAPAFVTAAVATAMFAIVLPQNALSYWYVILSLGLCAIVFSARYSFSALAAFTATRTRTSAVMLAGQQQGGKLAWLWAIMFAPWAAWAVVGDIRLMTIAAVAGVSLAAGYVSSLTLIPAIAARIRGPIRWDAVAWMLPVYHDILALPFLKVLIRVLAVLAFLTAAFQLWSTPNMFTKLKNFEERPVYVLASSPAEVDAILTKLKSIPQAAQVQWLGTFLPGDVLAKQRSLAALGDQFAPISPIQAQDPADIRDQVATLLGSLQAIATSPLTRPELAAAAQEFRRSLVLLNATSNDREIQLFEKRMFGSFNVLPERAKALSEIAVPNFDALGPQLKSLFLSPQGLFRLTVGASKNVSDSALATTLADAGFAVANPALMQSVTDQLIFRKTVTILIAVLGFTIMAMMSNLRSVARMTPTFVSMAMLAVLVSALAVWQRELINQQFLLLLTPTLAIFAAIAAYLYGQENKDGDEIAEAIEGSEMWLPTLLCAAIAAPCLFVNVQPLASILIEMAEMMLLMALILTVVQRPLSRWLQA